MCENAFKPSKEWWGFVKTELEMVRLPLHDGTRPGCLGTPFLHGNSVLIVPMVFSTTEVSSLFTTSESPTVVKITLSSQDDSSLDVLQPSHFQAFNFVRTESISLLLVNFNTRIWSLMYNKSYNEESSNKKKKRKTGIKKWPGKRLALCLETGFLRGDPGSNLAASLASSLTSILLQLTSGVR